MSEGQGKEFINDFITHYISKKSIQEIKDIKAFYNTHMFEICDHFTLRRVIDYVRTELGEAESSKISASSASNIDDIISRIDLYSKLGSFLIDLEKMNKIFQKKKIITNYYEMLSIIIGVVDRKIEQYIDDTLEPYVKPIFKRISKIHGLNASKEQIKDEFSEIYKTLDMNHVFDQSFGSVQYISKLFDLFNLDYTTHEITEFLKVLEEDAELEQFEREHAPNNTETNESELKYQYNRNIPSSELDEEHNKVNTPCPFCSGNISLDIVEGDLKIVCPHCNAPLKGTITGTSKMASPAPELCQYSDLLQYLNKLQLSSLTVESVSMLYDSYKSFPTPDLCSYASILQYLEEARTLNPGRRQLRFRITPSKVWAKLDDWIIGKLDDIMTLLCLTHYFILIDTLIVGAEYPYELNPIKLEDEISNRLKECSSRLSELMALDPQNVRDKIDLGWVYWQWSAKGLLDYYLFEDKDILED